MKDSGFPIWAITTQNEPSMGLFINSEWNAMGWTPKHQLDWLARDLIPLFTQNQIDTKIIIFDENRIFLPQWVEYVLKNETVRNGTHGIAVHWYWDDLVPVSVVQKLQTMFPEKELISSEACSKRGPRGLEYFMAWTQGEDYSRDIIENFKHSFTAWIDWNLALDTLGGPNWAGNMRNAGVIVNSLLDEFYKAPSFYHLQHFSHFILPKSKLIKSDFRNGIVVQRPDGYKVAVVLNDRVSAAHFTIIDSNRKIHLTLPKRSIQSVIWK